MRSLTSVGNYRIAVNGAPRGRKIQRRRRRAALLVIRRGDSRVTARICWDGSRQPQFRSVGEDEGAFGPAPRYDFIDRTGIGSRDVIGSWSSNGRVMPFAVVMEVVGAYFPPQAPEAARTLDAASSLVRRRDASIGGPRRCANVKAAAQQTGVCGCKGSPQKGRAPVTIASDVSRRAVTPRRRTSITRSIKGCFRPSRL